MTTRAGLPFKILEKTFFTRSREEYFRVIEALKKGFRFLFPLKNGAAEPCEFDHNQFHATWLFLQVVIRSWQDFEKQITMRLVIDINQMS